MIYIYKIIKSPKTSKKYTYFQQNTNHYNKKNIKVLKKNKFQDIKIKVYFLKINTRKYNLFSIINQNIFNNIYIIKFFTKKKQFFFVFYIYKFIHSFYILKFL